MTILKEKPDVIKDKVTHYCAGCGHGIIHRIVAECIEEFDIGGDFIGIAPVGCAVLMYHILDVDYIEVAHGRAPAVATGIKKVCPEKFVLSYQGDGDLAAIGMGEIIHAANRGMNITVIFVNNAVYGMTGGQMAPTTLLGQKSTTCKNGRNVENDGHPVKVSELLAAIECVTYIERVAVNSPKDIVKAEKAIKKAFSNQIENKGFSLIEVLSMCPVNWHLNTIESLGFVDRMMEVFPLGVFKDS